MLVTLISIKMLDTTFITTMQTALIALFVFLLGVRMLPIHEDIRTLYIRTFFYKKLNRLFRTLTIGLIFYVLIWGNAVFIHSIISKHLLSQFVYYVSLGYDMFAIVFFVQYVRLVIRYSIKSSDKDYNIRIIVIEDILDNVKSCYDNNGRFDKSSIEELSELGRSYSSGVNRSIYLKEQYELVNYVLTHTSHIYNGSQLTDLLEQTILPYTNELVGNENHCKTVLDICNVVKKKYTDGDNLQDFDANAIIKVLYVIGEQAVEKNMFGIVMDVLYVFRHLNAVHDKVFSLCKLACEKKEFGILTIEITYLESHFSKEKTDDITKTSFICYLSWLWSNNGKTKQYALSMIARVKRKLNVKDFVEAENELYLRAKFDDSQMIANFKTYVIDNRLL